MPEERDYLGEKCPCGGRLYQLDADWAACDKCKDDGFPLSSYAAGFAKYPEESWRTVASGVAKHLGVWKDGMSPDDCHCAIFAKLMRKEMTQAYSVLPASPESDAEVTRREDGDQSIAGHLTLIDRAGTISVIAAPARDGNILPPAGLIQFSRPTNSPRTILALMELFTAMKLDNAYDERRNGNG